MGDLCCSVLFWVVLRRALAQLLKQVAREHLAPGRAMAFCSIEHGTMLPRNVATDAVPQEHDGGDGQYEEVEHSREATIEDEKLCKKVALHIFDVISASGDFHLPWTALAQVIAGTWKPTDSQRLYCSTRRIMDTMDRIRTERVELPGHIKTQAFTRNLLAALMTQGYVASETLAANNVAGVRPSCTP